MGNIGSLFGPLPDGWDLHLDCRPDRLRYCLVYPYSMWPHTVPNERLQRRHELIFYAGWSTLTMTWRKFHTNTRYVLRLLVDNVQVLAEEVQTENFNTLCKSQLPSSDGRADQEGAHGGPYGGMCAIILKAAQILKILCQVMCSSFVFWPSLRYLTDHIICACAPSFFRAISIHRCWLTCLRNIQRNCKWYVKQRCYIRVLFWIVAHYFLDMQSSLESLAWNKPILCNTNFMRTYQSFHT